MGMRRDRSTSARVQENRHAHGHKYSRESRARARSSHNKPETSEQNRTESTHPIQSGFALVRLLLLLLESHALRVRHVLVRAVVIERSAVQRLAELLHRVLVGLHAVAAAAARVVLVAGGVMRERVARRARVGERRCDGVGVDVDWHPSEGTGWWPGRASVRIERREGHRNAWRRAGRTRRTPELGLRLRRPMRWNS